MKIKNIILLTTLAAAALTGYSKETNMSNKKVNVWFPEESFCSVESQTKEGHPVLIIIQDSLKKFKFKDGNLPNGTCKIFPASNEYCTITLVARIR